MERGTTWRSSLWARWLGWTVLYALVVYGVNVGLALLLTSFWFHIPFLFRGSEGSIVLSLVLFLVPAVLAFVIGVRLRSRWWALGLLAVLALPAAMVLAEAAMQALDEESQAWAVVFAGWFVVYGVLFSLIGIAGVWWGKRRQPAVTSHAGGPVDDALRPGQR